MEVGIFVLTDLSVLGQRCVCVVRPLVHTDLYVLGQRCVCVAINS